MRIPYVYSYNQGTRKHNAFLMSLYTDLIGKSNKGIKKRDDHSIVPK